MLIKYFPSQYNGADWKGHVTYNMGGGDSPAPQPTQTSQVTIPEYAKPTVERMIGKAEALTNAPYQTYGGQRIAVSSPEQQAARQGVAQMGPAQQFSTATGLAGQAGQAGLAAAQYQPGVFMAPMTQAAQLERFQAAGPSGVQSGLGSFAAPGAAEQFMSPYMQNVVDVQKREAVRAAQQGQLAQNLAAARQGTYGGARQLLAATERERNLQDQMAKIQATGSQAAYDQAQRAFEAEQARGLQAGLQTQQLGTQTGLQNLQALLGVQQLGAQQGLQSQQLNQQALMDAQRMAEQSRQFGGTLGLQGSQAATQAAATLGQLGTSQQAADLQRLQAQEQFGALGTQERQRALDLAYQDFISQRQDPYKQLGFLSDILRGSANLAATGGKAVYEAPPSTMSQLAGLGTAAYGMSRLGGFAGGGLADLGMYNLMRG
jgi:hypothetical protein